MVTVSESLPEQTADDTDLGWGDWREKDRDDDFYLDNKPPHWS